MTSNFNEKNCLCKAIEISGLGERRFNDLFKISFGVTPNRYIILTRVEFAKTLLGSGYLSISEIAEKSGFSDIYYFSKLFKKEVGVSPSEWKTICSIT